MRVYETQIKKPPFQVAFLLITSVYFLNSYIVALKEGKPTVE